MHKDKKTKRALVITPTPTHPQNSGNRARIHTLLTRVREFGYEIHLIYTGMEDMAEHIGKKSDHEAMQKEWDETIFLGERDIISEKGIKGIQKHITNVLRVIDRHIGRYGRKLFEHAPKLYQTIKYVVPDNIFGLSQPKTITTNGLDRWYTHELDREVKQRARKESYDVVIVQYVFLSYAFKHFDTSVLKVLDTHDIFADRDAGYVKKGLRENFFSTSIEEENRGFERADVIVAIQAREAEEIRKRTNKPVVTIGHSAERSIQTKKGDAKTVGFFGSNNTANRAALKHVLKDIFPKVCEKVPGTQLLVGGTVGKHMPKQENVEYLGEVVDGGIQAMYNKMDVVLNVTTVGTGLKIKFVEALSFGKAIVSVEEAVSGFPGAEQCSAVVPKESVADTVALLLSDKKKRNTLEQNAIKCAKTYHAQVVGSIRDVFAMPPYMKVSEHGTPSKKESTFMIFTWPRCGATSLTKILSAHKAISMCDEPFHQKYGKQFDAEDIEGPQEYLNELYETVQGVKHNWGLTFEQNVPLLVTPGRRILFFPRENATQREMSQFIAQNTNWWDERTKDYVPPKKLPPIDIEKALHNMRMYRRDVQRYRLLLLSSKVPFFECRYEDLFGPTVKKEDQYMLIRSMASFLGYTFGPRMEENADIRNALDPDFTRPDTEEIYRLVPNVEEFSLVAQEYGFGRLFLG